MKVSQSTDLEVFNPAESIYQNVITTHKVISPGLFRRGNMEAEPLLAGWHFSAICRFSLPLLVAVLHGQITPWYTVVGNE
jgi:hypothetical protein